MSTIALTPIGIVIGGRAGPVDDDWGAVEAVIELSGTYPVEALAGLEEFSHIDVVFLFHLVGPDDVTMAARHPRGRADWPKVGIYAQRAKARPNRLGVTTCELLDVEGRTLRTRGLDAIHSTPVLDIKPYMTQFGPRTPVRQPPWADELMRDYW